MIALLVLLGALAAPPAVEQTAFFCDFDRRANTTSHTLEDITPHKQLALLLSGKADTVGQSDPITLYDPDALVDAKASRRLLRKDQNFAVAFGTGPKTQLLSLMFTKESVHPHFKASLADMTTLEGVVGFCIPMQSDHAASDFADFVSRGGWKKK